MKPGKRNTAIAAETIGMTTMRGSSLSRFLIVLIGLVWSCALSAETITYSNKERLEFNGYARNILLDTVCQSTNNCMLLTQSWAEMTDTTHSKLVLWRLDETGATEVIAATDYAKGPASLHKLTPVEGGLFLFVQAMRGEPVYVYFDLKKKLAVDKMPELKALSKGREILSVYNANTESYIALGDRGQFDVQKVANRSSTSVGQPLVDEGITSVLDISANNERVFIAGGAIRDDHQTGYLFADDLTGKHHRSQLDIPGRYVFSVDLKEPYILLRSKSVTDGSESFSIYRMNADDKLGLVGEISSTGTAIASSSGHICGDYFYNAMPDPKDRQHSVNLKLLKPAKGSMEDAGQFVLKADFPLLYTGAKVIPSGTGLRTLLNVIQIDEKTRRKRETVMSIGIDGAAGCS